MNQTRILIVHHDPSVGKLMTSMLQTLGHKIDEAPNDRVAVRMLEQAPANLVLAGAEPDHPDALEFLTCLRRKYPHMPVILLFPGPHPERARDAMVRGAAAVLRFPLPATGLRAAVAQALGEPEPFSGSKPAGGAVGYPTGAGNLSNYSSTAIGNGVGNGVGHANGGHGYRNGLSSPISAMPNGLGNGYRRIDVGPPMPSSAAPGRTEEIPALITNDPVLRQVVELASTIAPTRAPVLIGGEKGVGKTLLARTMHRQGPRPDAPLFEISCSTIKEAQLEAELFGRRGDGITSPDVPGKIAAARGGTIVLEEVSALSDNLQEKLLRLLRDNQYESAISGTTEAADVRVIMTTREDLATLAREGMFRQDLYYRISVVALKLPPLRHREDDMDRLADHFRARFARQMGKDVTAFSPEVVDVLRSHPWPGNVLELEQAIERAVVVCRGVRIEPNHLALINRETGMGRPSSRPRRPHVNLGILPLKEALEGPEKELILQALEALNWNRQETARVLDINRTTLYKKMKKYGLLFDEPAWAN